MVQKALISFLLVFGFCVFSSSAKDIDIRGVITGDDGKPVAGAEVKLLITNITTKTDDVGKYSILATDIQSKLHNHSKHLYSFTVQKSFITVSISQVGTYDIQLYALNGKNIANLSSGYLKHGAHTFSLGSYLGGSQVYILRIASYGQVNLHKISGTTSHYQSNTIKADIQAQDIVGLSTSEQKSGDSLIVSHQNYERTVKYLSDLQGTVNFTMKKKVVAKRIMFFAIRCIRCSRCYVACKPYKAISRGSGTWVIDPKKCNLDECGGKCLTSCPRGDKKNIFKEKIIETFQKVVAMVTK